jgi:hypothetical protein
MLNIKLPDSRPESEKKPWVTYSNYSKIPGEFEVRDLKDSAIFSVSIRQASEYKNAIYMIKEVNTGHFYIGKAKGLSKRINSHRLAILANIKRTKGSIKKVKSRTLDVHRELAKLYFQNGRIDIHFSVIANGASYELHKDEKAHILHALTLCDNSLCLNVFIKKKVIPVLLGSS